MGSLINIKILPKCAVCDSELISYMLEPAFKTDKKKSLTSAIPTLAEGVTTIYEEVYQEGVLFIEPCKNGCKSDDVQAF
ncbi:MAG: hypothetical protein H8E81_04720 [Deltaproteobacteria bacterium]|nr:hypothetical protein [Deltaproteobacteria bacterium]